MCCSFRRLQERLKAMDHETEIMEDWRDKYTILKSELDAADEIIQQGKNANITEETEDCYLKLKVYIGLMCNIKGAL